MLRPSVLASFLAVLSATAFTAGCGAPAGGGAPGPGAGSDGALEEGLDPGGPDIDDGREAGRDDEETGNEADTGAEADSAVIDSGADSGTSTDAGTKTDAGGGSGDSGGAPGGGISCPKSMATEVFRDDFEGTSIDTTKWNVVEQNNGGGTFTQLTKMLKENVRVSGGTLKLATKRHCVDPYPAGSPEHPALCSGTNYYSGAWLKTARGYAPGKGIMIFHAKVFAPVRGTFPALWARNTRSGTNGHYLEMDLMEQWWDYPKGVAGNPNTFAVTTHLDTTTQPYNSTRNNGVGPYASFSDRFHVFEVEWNATVTPAWIKYWYRDTPTAPRQLMRALFASSSWKSAVTDAQFAEAIEDVGCTGAGCGMRAYIDTAVTPDTAWNVGPNTASTFDPGDLEVDSVIICK